MALLRDELTTDFGRGMYQDIAATAYPSNVAALIVNGRILSDGTVQRRWGSKRLHAAPIAAGTGYGGIEITTAAGQVQQVVFIGTTAWRSINNGVTWVQIGAGLRADYYSFATMRVGSVMYLYAASGDTVVYRYDGTTFDTNPNAPSGVKYLSVYNGRLYYAGHSGVIVQATKIGDPSVLATPNGLLVQIITHDGDVPTGMFQLGKELLVFDEQSTSYIDGYGEQTIIVAAGATGLSRSVGCVSFRSIVGVGDSGVCWQSKRGLEFYSPATGILLVSRGIQQFMDSVDQNAIKVARGIPSATYDDRTQHYFISVPSTESDLVSGRNNRTVVLNLLQRGRGWMGAPSIDQSFSADEGAAAILFQDDGAGYLGSGGALKFVDDGSGYATTAAVGDTTISDTDGYLSTATNESAAASYFMANGQLHSVGYDGYVRRHEEGDFDDLHVDGTGGIAVELDMLSRPFILRAPRNKKRVRKMYVGSINEAPATVTGRIVANVKNGNPIDMVIPGTDPDFDQPQEVRKKTTARGWTPQLEITTTDPVRIAMLGVAAEILREPA